MPDAARAVTALLCLALTTGAPVPAALSENDEADTVFGSTSTDSLSNEEIANIHMKMFPSTLVFLDSSIEFSGRQYHKGVPYDPHVGGDVIPKEGSEGLNMTQHVVSSTALGLMRSFRKSLEPKAVGFLQLLSESHEHHQRLTEECAAPAEREALQQAVSRAKGRAGDLHFVRSRHAFHRRAAEAQRQSLTDLRRLLRHLHGSDLPREHAAKLSAVGERLVALAGQLFPLDVPTAAGSVPEQVEVRSSSVHRGVENATETLAELGESIGRMDVDSTRLRALADACGDLTLSDVSGQLHSVQAWLVDERKASRLANVLLPFDEVATDSGNDTVPRPAALNQQLVAVCRGFAEQEARLKDVSFSFEELVSGLVSRL